MNFLNAATRSALFSIAETLFHSVFSSGFFAGVVEGFGLVTFGRGLGDCENTEIESNVRSEIVVKNFIKYIPTRLPMSKSYHEIAFSRPASYSRFMTELDELWSQMLGSNASFASEAGRRHIADYLKLKATNDAVRQVGVGWLIDSLIEIAGPALRDHPKLTVEREEPHRFARGNSMMVGSLIVVRQGVRCMTVEAGWARTPADGIMLRGALAFARITHFGMPKAGAEFRLCIAGKIPCWTDDSGSVIDTSEIQRHFDLFLER